MPDSFDPPEATRRRSWRQRLLIGSGAFLTAACLLVAGGLAWGVWKWAQIERVSVALDEAGFDEPQNFLLVGSDSRAAVDGSGSDAGVLVGGGSPTGQRADTIMIARVHPDGERIELLSLPRDLWLPLAGTGEEERINGAYNSGPQELIDTISMNFGIPIHHYVEVDFEGFKRTVDALGGVPMYFDSTLLDTESGLYIDATGCRVLDGSEGLAYARARNLQYSDGVEWRDDPSGDLGRITRQQQFLQAALAKVTALDLTDISTVSDLVDIAVDSVVIDESLSFDELVALGQRFSEFDSESLEAHSIPAVPDETDGGASVVLVDESAAAPLVEAFGGSLEAAETSSSVEPVAVSVLNGSGVPGQAHEAGNSLEALGYGILGVADAPDSPVSETVVRHGAAAEGAAGEVADLLDAETELDTSLGEDEVVIVTGTDFSGVHAVDEGAGSSSSPATGPGEPATTTTEAPGVVPADPPPGVTCE
ncbi:MAG: Cell wall biosynthesis protein LcpA [Acidimicrobiales bacterium]|nr:Cell wall biosynthesis protein LcpA [Acidimicrobiales bacterium]